MINAHKISRLMRTVLLSLLGTFALASCGGGGGGSNQPTGNVSVLVTDLPTDDYCAINLTVSEVRLLGDDGQIRLYSNPAGKVINLLELEHYSEVFSYTQGVPAGHYSKIRLELEGDVQLKPDGSCDPADESQWIEARVPSGKIDLNPQGDFTVPADGIMIVELDMDAKAFKLTQTGNGQYLVRPVVFVDVLSHAGDGKLVRVFGSVANKMSGDTGGSFELCGTEIGWHGDDDDNDARCVMVNVSGNTSFFNELGDPTDFGAIDDDPAVGQTATVIARLNVEGMHEAAGDDENGHNVVLDAEVVEIGSRSTYGRYTGILQSLPADETDSFDFDFDPPQGFEEGTVIPVQLQNGTKLFSRNGDPLTVGDFVLDQRARVEGVMVLGDTDFLKSSIVWLDVDTENMLYIGSMDPATIDLAARSFTLVPTGDSVNITMDRVVELTADAEIILLEESGGAWSHEHIDLNEMAALTGTYDARVYGYERTDATIVADRVVLHASEPMSSP